MNAKITEIKLNDGAVIKLTAPWKALSIVLSIFPDQREQYFEVMGTPEHDYLNMIDCFYVHYLCGLVVDNDGKLPETYMSRDDFMDNMPQHPASIITIWNEMMSPN